MNAATTFLTIASAFVAHRAWLTHRQAVRNQAAWERLMRSLRAGEFDGGAK